MARAASVRLEDRWLLSRQGGAEDVAAWMDLMQEVECNLYHVNFCV
jgi:hypothetical protein